MLVAFSLLAALFYGAGDFCGGLSSKRSAVLSVAFVSQSVGFVLLLGLLPFFPSTWSGGDLLWGALAGICGAAGIALLYHALSIGKMGLISPVTAVIAAAIPVLASAISGERLATTQWVGIGLALVAIVLISASFEGGVREITTRGLKEALLSGILLGGFYIFLAHTHRESGIHNLVGARVASMLFLGALALGSRVTLRPSANALPLLLATGALDMAANILYVVATFNGVLAIAAVITSLYPASTVFLARLVLNERLRAAQWLGVVFALAGVALIALRR